MLRHFRQCVKHPHETQRFFNKIIQHLPTLSAKFPNISIPSIHAKNNYGCIYYEKENQRGPILSYIKHRIDHRFKCKTSHKILDKCHDIAKRLQFKAWSRNSDYMTQLESFLLKFGYAQKHAITRITVSRQTYELSWTCSESKVRDMFPHWQSQNIPVEIVQSNYNQHIATQKQNATTALQQSTAYAMKQLLDSYNHPELTHLAKYYSNMIFDKDTPPITVDELAYNHHQYPFLQLLNADIQPKTNVNVDKFKLKISVLNLDGGATTKLQDHHPYINRLIKTHYPHLMVLNIRKTYSILLSRVYLWVFQVIENTYSIGGILIQT